LRVFILSYGEFGLYLSNGLNLHLSKQLDCVKEIQTYRSAECGNVRRESELHLDSHFKLLRGNGCVHCLHDEILNFGLRRKFLSLIIFSNFLKIVFWQKRKKIKEY